jgi:hypothetical protein
MQVRVFVRTALAVPILLLEGVLATATRYVQGYDAGTVSSVVLAHVLTVQEQLTRNGAEALSSRLPPAMGLLPALRMQCVLEDLAEART